MNQQHRFIFWGVLLIVVLLSVSSITFPIFVAQTIKNQNVICIDAGHGGSDPGKVGTPEDETMLLIHRKNILFLFIIWCKCQKYKLRLCLHKEAIYIYWHAWTTRTEKMVWIRHFMGVRGVRGLRNCGAMEQSGYIREWQNLFWHSHHYMM